VKEKKKRKSNRLSATEHYRSHNKKAIRNKWQTGRKKKNKRKKEKYSNQEMGGSDVVSIRIKTKHGIRARVRGRLTRKTLHEGKKKPSQRH